MRGARPAALAACASVVAFAGTAHAYRPFDGTDADVTERGKFELELGPTHFYREADRNYLFAPAAVLNLGIFERTELVVDYATTVALGALDPGEPRVRATDSDVLVKHVFREGILQGATGPSIATELGPLLPDVNGTAAFGASLDVITSYQWSVGTIHWNEWGQYTREHDLSLFSGVILEGPHTWTVRPVVELFVDHDFDAETTCSGLAGAIWTVRDSLSVDVAGRMASIDGVRAYEARFGFTWAVPVWEPGGAGMTAAALWRGR